MSTTLGKLREYETLIVIHPELTDDAVAQEIERLKGVLEKTGATLLREDKWGKRKLAFEVKKQIKGNYQVLHYASESASVDELERIIRNSDTIIRFMTTLKGPVTDIEAKKAEVENMVKEAAAAKARAERERQERAADAAANAAAAAAQQQQA